MDRPDAAAWCEGNDRLNVAEEHFYLNGKRLPDYTVTDATEETLVAFEYDDRLFMSCDHKAAP
jgi:hypothetical protein